MHSGKMHIFPGSPDRFINMLGIGGVEDRYFIPSTSVLCFLEVGEETTGGPTIPNRGDMSRFKTEKVSLAETSAHEADNIKQGQNLSWK